MSALVPGVRKIAVLRPNAVGDFVFALPALHALRQAYPEAELSYIGKAWHAAFLGGRPGPVDRVIVIPPGGHSSGRERCAAALAAAALRRRGRRWWCRTIRGRCIWRWRWVRPA